MAPALLSPALQSPPLPTHDAAKSATIGRAKKPLSILFSRELYKGELSLLSRRR